MTSLSSHPVALDVAARIAAPVGALGGSFMLDPTVLGPGKAAGYPGGFSYYVVGRGGVLGDVDADVVVSAFGFFAPDLVTSLWNAGVSVEGARAGARRYAEGCATWGRTHLAGFGGAERLAELVGRVVDEAEVGGLSLFAGWRAMERPSDPVGRCYLLLHVLRELRGSAHLLACVASGLTPLEAVLANPTGGAATAERFGWSGPFDADPEASSRFAAAEELTNRLMAKHLEVLASSTASSEPAGKSGLTELAELISAASTHVAHPLA